ncbi:hypothetical protein ACVWZS_001131 [Pseudomonas fragi]
MKTYPFRDRRSHWVPDKNECLSFQPDIRPCRDYNLMEIGWAEVLLRNSLQQSFL